MKATILLLDDDPGLCSALRDRLVMEGYDVRTASDGRLGLRLYHESPVDLVITDVLMPEMDGLEVIRVLAGTPSPPLMIAMSGGESRDLGFLVEAAEFGATRTLSKPFLPNDLLSLVKELLSTLPHSST
ncbi:response regulator [Candidatus Nitrospira allomarina]|uniref:Response regulator n=1 Tax=Candidatus Nitrospira allomarina TaxID=3020900 RepID=A0AA96JXA8_9BACT|nr:response regulator [Candidatus Nitrospira allomarina]WNM58786.1 response regulator [Candidatus Nitrospira allomarina]